MKFQNLRIAPLMGRVTFDILDTDLAIVNSLRRAMLSDIPTVGFVGEGEPTVEVHKNTGPLHNEIIIHRVGMIPLHLTDEEIEGFQEGLYEFELSVENKTNDTINVTTHNFNGTRDGKPMSDREIHTIFPANKVSGDPVLITRLRAGESLSLTARAVKATAKHHASFSPISMCSMRFLPDPEAIEKADGILDKERAFLMNKYNEPVAIEFAFEMENSNAMKDIESAKYLVYKALDSLMKRLDDAIQHEEDKVTCKEIENGFEYTFENEDDTLGNLLQSLMFNRHVREGQAFQDVKISYVGYMCPHPLDPTMVLRVMFEDKTLKRDISFAWALLMDNCSWIRSTLLGISNEWEQFILSNSVTEKEKTPKKTTKIKK